MGKFGSRWWRSVCFALALGLAIGACVPAAAQQTFYDAYEMGLAHERAGRWTAALAVFETAVELRPQAGRNISTFGRDVLEVYDPYFHLARVSLELGRIDDARRFLDRARSEGVTPDSELDELDARLGRPPPVRVTHTVVVATPTRLVEPTSTPVPTRRDTPIVVTHAPDVASTPTETATSVAAEVVGEMNPESPSTAEEDQPPKPGGGGLLLVAVLAVIVVAVVLRRRRRASPSPDPVPDFETTPTRRVETGTGVAVSNTPAAANTGADKVVGHYRLLDRLGRGGMATTYRAENTRDGRVVALKIPHDHLLDDREFAERFLREGALGATIHHPNIIRIFEAGKHEEVPFIAMELIEGETLEARLTRDGALSVSHALEIARGIALALDYAHVKGVVHRDVKPDNVMLLPDGTVKVMDFGIARVASSPGLTATNIYLGTPFYSAPEAIDPEQVGPHSDLYSLGIVLYRMLSNRVPFEAPSPLKVVELHRTAPLPPFAAELQIPAPVQSFVAKLTAKGKADRYRSAEVFLHELNGYLTGTSAG